MVVEEFTLQKQRDDRISKRIISYLLLSSVSDATRFPKEHHAHKSKVSIACALLAIILATTCSTVFFLQTASWLMLMMMEVVLKRSNIVLRQVLNYSENFVGGFFKTFFQFEMDER